MQASDTISLGDVLELVTVLCSSAGFLWGAWRFVHGRIEGVRAETLRKCEAVRLEAAQNLADHKREVASELREVTRGLDDLRSNCARRDDFGRLETAVGGVHRRIDTLLAMFTRRAPAPAEGDA